MYTDCRVQIVVRCSHDSRSGRSGRQPSNVNALWINRIVAHDLVSDARDKRRFTSATLLVGCAKPVPAFRLVCLAALSLITAGDEEPVGTASRRIAVGTFDEPCALRQDVRRGHQGPLNHTSPSEPGALPCAIEQRAEHARLSGCGPR